VPKPKEPTNRRLLRVRQAATYLSLSCWSLRNLIAAGKLPAVQINEGGPFLIDLADLDRFVESNKHTAM
jgi:excisionase family DNA binding protein